MKEEGTENYKTNEWNCRKVKREWKRRKYMNGKGKKEKKQKGENKAVR